MAWSNSKIFRQYLADSLNRTAAFDLNADTFTVALYDNDITPDNDVSAANGAYNAGQWASAGNEVSESGQWATGGVNLASVTVDVGTADVVFFDAADTASGSAADLANVYGCLVYDNTLTTPVADQGVCYNYFGGANSVVNGTFTVVWSANGIMRYTL
jgi:hypothetical protein